MESSEPSHDRLLLVVCPGCKEELHPRRDQRGSKIECTLCGDQVLVPLSAKPKPKPARQVEEYGIHELGFVAEPVDYIRIACPLCGTLLYAEPDQEGQRIACPDCGTESLVKRVVHAPLSKPQPEKIGQYEVLEDGQATRVSPDDYFLLLCPLCNARMHPSRKLVGKRVRCPDCKQVVPVPEAPPRKEVWRPPPVEGYGVERSDLPEPERLGPEHYFAFTCPKCSARLKSLREQAGQEMECPDCGLQFTVPGAPKVRVKRPREIVEEEAVSSEIVQAPPMRPPVQPDAIANRIPLPPPPKWTFFSGVLGFPWRRDAISRWATLSGLFVATGLPAVFAFSMLGEMSIGGQIMGVLLSLPVLLMGTGMIGFGSAVMLAVVEETASGADEITTWPEANVAEWIMPTLQFGCFVGLAASLGHGIGWTIARDPLVATACSVVASWMLFPVMLISALEAESAWLPISIPILKSLVSRAAAWLLFYVLSGIVVLVPLALVAWGMVEYPSATIVVAGPVLAASWLINARLIGRLARKVTT